MKARERIVYADGDIIQACRMRTRSHVSLFHPRTFFYVPLFQLWTFETPKETQSLAVKLSASLDSLAALLGVAAQYVESLGVDGLMGSHFGVLSIPGTYDYVIIGGATAGLTMFKRLAEDKRYTLAVAGAGDFAEFANGNNSQIPALAASFIGSDPKIKNPYLYWYQWMTKQGGLGGRSVVYMSGKVLGYGSKSAEFTPPNEEYRLHNATTLYDEDYWGPDSGPLQFGYPNWANPISSWIARGLEYLGLENLPERQGQENPLDDDKKAIGAVVESTGVEYHLSASREFIVSARAFRSPQLLMVSGIGSENTLKKFGIKVISNLKDVGQNMRDHIAFSPSYVVNLLTHSAMSRPDFAVEQLTNYQSQWTGQLTNYGGDVPGSGVH
ncbi:Versicolorin B synthase-like protein [Emericellopsis cladophorae]|uniref:Versicolorin B synthase-like protein n=1 Tax=Emericellopsis cladophorae TaxID=2686198 RepID=A0A9Q0BED0_9HYPO|nr:Versicolorin B synthase-like protein [Emericellopsis cladophorae]KAI6781731.1 Versicolorin B synthase-like protein [Emericellopsis cladophorae]